MEHLKNPLVIGAICGVIMVVLAYLDFKYNDTEYTTGTYFKLFGSTTVLVAGVVYLASIGKLPMTGGSGVEIRSLRGGGGGRSYDVYTNVPDF